MILAFLSWSSSAHASDYGPKDDQNTTAEQDQGEQDQNYRIKPFPGAPTSGQKTLITSLEVLYQGLNALDAAETISCVHKPTCQEGNPLLGSRPSNGTVIAFKLASAGAHFLVYRHQINRSEKRALMFEVITNVVQGTVCGLNLRYAF
jgi:hypothetical protein